MKRRLPVFRILGAVDDWLGFGSTDYTVNVEKKGYLWSLQQLPPQFLPTHSFERLETVLTAHERAGALRRVQTSRDVERQCESERVRTASSVRSCTFAIARGGAVALPVAENDGKNEGGKSLPSADPVADPRGPFSGQQ
ncbi:hypothetical protein PRIPAC_76295 [Pristionchus pacificus]|uniref:Uncharacterized protein n=1 Tax=Pristionchus pacificus TaxID=54126 RepID=A0A2A6CRU7_PRIPA|nr:hypothetical protein PRIPAC_76295 [Pristionchus pacificus]|eukprot:PDM80859.1 hypothetical protein PRIPAC_35862 [Pristionchus pacificus]